MGIFFPHGMGPGQWEPKARGRASGKAAVHPGVAREGEGPDGRADRALVEVGGAARGHDRVGSLGGGGVSHRHQAAEDRRLGRDRWQPDDRPDHRGEDRTRDAAAVAAARGRRSEFQLEQLRRGLQLCLHELDLVDWPADPAGRASADQPPADGAQSAGGIRAAVRERIDAGRARRAPDRAPEHSRFGARRARGAAEDARSWRPPGRQPVHRRDSRDRAAHPARGRRVQRRA